ncbi:MAG TPA: thioesterase family protein [Rugosimonospora sp.]|nr:thioesterase family protein [Rugosimonospora sp.]
MAEATFDVQVRWSDPDQLGHVNHARYLTYFEDARMDLLASSPLGVPGSPKDRGCIAARVAVDYRRQVNFAPGLVLTVRTTVGRLGTSSFTLHQRLYAPGVDTPVAECECVLVAFDYVANRSRPLEDDERDYLAALR